MKILFVFNLLCNFGLLLVGIYYVRRYYIIWQNLWEELHKHRNLIYNLEASDKRLIVLLEDNQFTEKDIHKAKYDMPFDLELAKIEGCIYCSAENYPYKYIGDIITGKLGRVAVFVQETEFIQYINELKERTMFCIIPYEHDKSSGIFYNIELETHNTRFYNLPKKNII